MARASQTMNQRQIPEWPRLANMHVEGLDSQFLHVLRQPRRHRVARPGSVRLYPQVRRAVFHQRNQGQHGYAAHQADHHEVALPPQRLNEQTGYRSKSRGANASGSPQDADAQSQPAPEPAAD